MDKKPIAIILPCYNSGKHLAPAVESIINNTEYPWKLILVESESTDGTDKVCDTFAKENDKIEVYHTKKEGITKAINFGIDKAGELDVYLTQDDVIIPNLYGRDWLTEIIKGKDKELCGVISTIQGGGVSGQIYIKDFQWAGTWSLFIPRKTIKKVGKFDENFSPGSGDDIDYSYRVNKAGLRIYLVNFWVDHHRQTENFNDKLKYRGIQNAGYFRKKHNIKPSWSGYSFNNEKFLLDDRTMTQYGCINPQGELDDPYTMLEIVKITKKFKKTDTTLDVGANTGLMSLAVQKGKVFAFEPTPSTFEILKNNTIINEWKNITPVNEAVYDKKINYVISFAVINGKPWSGMNKIQQDKDGKKETIFLDDYMVNIKNIRLIKIDTETCDLEVLKGASKILDRDSPILITEHISSTEPFLIKKGYKLTRRIGVQGINSVWEKK